MDFKARLATLTSRPTVAPAAPAPELTQLAFLAPAQPTALGPLHLRCERRPSPELLACAGQAGALAALALDASLEDLDTSRLLFLDTETTGLSGGTGTLAFVVGAAREVAGELVLEQAFLPRPGAERPVLQWLAARLAEASCLVTFNGKAFDWPLLKSRFVMNRLAVPAARPHLDLLHVSRRVYRHALSELRLTALEVHALAVHRRGDIDGADIPTAYFDYLRTGRVATMARVLEHNARDVRSMVELLAVLVAAWRGERAPSAEEALGLATVAFRRGDDGRARGFLEVAVRGPSPLRAAALALSAKVHRRAGAPRQAAEAMEQALALSTDRAPLHLALAKLYEHCLKDARRALHHAEGAAPEEGLIAAQRRRARLERRLGRLPLDGARTAAPP